MRALARRPTTRNLRRIVGGRSPVALGRDLTLLVVGLFAHALGQSFTLQSNLGANSWNVFQDGIARQTPISIGQASQVVGLVMLAVAWRSGVPPGFATIANIVLVGLFLDAILGSGLIPVVDPYPLRAVYLLASVTLIGLGTALYIKAGFGAGPRDSFMLAVTRRTGWRVGVVRWLMEVSVVGLGIVLGGRFGIGTLIVAMLIGPAVGLGFRLLRVRAGRSDRIARATPAPALAE